MELLAKHFKEQLEKAKPCNGDYLQGETIDRLVAHRLRQYDSKLDFLFGMDTPGVKQKREGIVRASIENSIKAYERHKGEKIVFFMTETPGGIQVLRAWESELDTLHEKYDPVCIVCIAAGSYLPLLKIKS